ncbi:hypothetical protein A9Q99_22890 [Gammaproteobacteria bacterium 45_16_T64]|nr:hypothetical protein A9Q99_22890 [Gammaproteobacteria bacterium 45_16_T64]
MTLIEPRPFIVTGIIATLLIFLTSGCSSNTIVDDGAYRTIGGGSPRNPHPSTPEGLTTDPEFALDAEGGFSASGDFSYEGGIPKGSLPSSGPSSGGHVQRYGNGGVIEKIAKIANIHCNPLSFNISTQKQSFWGKESGTLTQCTYQFPAFCGNHQFSVLTYADKEVLIYDQSDSPYYIIDTLKGTNASQPGLWDKDDKLGSKASNMSYMFDANYNSHQVQKNSPLNLGWVIKASHHDEVQHGSSYHQAIKDTTRCF